MAAVTTLKAVEANLPVVSQILINPVCDNTATAESETWMERPNAPLLTKDRMLLFRELYLGSRNSPAGEHWTASPIRAPLDLLRKCPKTFIMVAGQDLLRGENIQYAQKLQGANVSVVVREYEGAPHPFMCMDGILESGKRGMDDLCKDMKKILAEHLEHSIINRATSTTSLTAKIL